MTVNFDADQPIDNSKLSELEILAGKASIDKAKEDEIIVSKGNITIHLLGKFTLTGNIVQEGSVLTGITVEKADLPVWDMSDLTVNAVGFLEKIKDAKLEQVLGHLFEKADKIAGSHFDDRLHGFAGADKINGWKGNDVISGEEGRDTLTGYAGNDSFVFDEKLNYHHADVITDFQVGLDQIWLKKHTFSELPKGELDADAFVIGHHAVNKGACIIYQPSTGIIYYDPDGTGHDDKKKFVTIDDHKDVTHHDFLVI